MSPTPLLSTTVVMSAGIAPSGDYKLCYSDDNGTTYFIQNSGVSIIVVAPAPTSLTGMAPSIAVAGTSTVLNYTGLVTTPTTMIAFSAAVDCSGAVAATSYATAPSAAVLIPAAGTYYICYSQNSGLTYTRESVTGLSLISISATPTSVGNLLPLYVPINTTPHMSTTSSIYTPTSVIGFSLFNCSAAFVESVTSVLSLSFTASLLYSSPLSPFGRLLLILPPAFLLLAFTGGSDCGGLLCLLLG